MRQPLQPLAAAGEPTSSTAASLIDPRTCRSRPVSLQLQYRQLTAAVPPAYSCSTVGLQLQHVLKQGL